MKGVYIKKFIDGTEDESFLSSLGRATFITLATACIDMVESNASSDGEIDYRGIVSDAYNNIYVPIMKTLIENDRILMNKIDAYEKAAPFIDFVEQLN